MSKETTGEPDRFMTASPDRMTDEGASTEDEDEEVHSTGDEPSVQGTASVDDEGNEDEEDEEDEEDDEEEDEDEDEEPALKYERLGGIAHQLLLKDSASALAYANQRLVSTRLWCMASQRFLIIHAQALGTHGGMLHILDLSGQHIKSFPAHSASVSDISVDLTGDFIATASIDGENFVRGLYALESYVS